MGEISRLRLVIAILVFSVPWLLLGLTYLGSPGYIGPFVRSLPGLITLLVSLVWDGIGLFIMLRSSTWLAWIIAIGFFVAPLLLVPMLGPAILTIAQALGPPLSRP